MSNTGSASARRSPAVGLCSGPAQTGKDKPPPLFRAGARRPNRGEGGHAIGTTTRSAPR